MAKMSMEIIFLLSFHILTVLSSLYWDDCSKYNAPATEEGDYENDFNLTTCDIFNTERHEGVWNDTIIGTEYSGTSLFAENSKNFDYSNAPKAIEEQDQLDLRERHELLFYPPSEVLANQNTVNVEEEKIPTTETSMEFPLMNMQINLDVQKVQASTEDALNGESVVPPPLRQQWPDEILEQLKERKELTENDATCSLEFPTSSTIPTSIAGLRMISLRRIDPLQTEKRIETEFVENRLTDGTVPPHPTLPSRHNMPSKEPISTTVLSKVHSTSSSEVSGYPSQSGQPLQIIPATHPVTNMPKSTTTLGNVDFIIPTLIPPPNSVKPATTIAPESHHRTLNEQPTNHFLALVDITAEETGPIHSKDPSKSEEPPVHSQEGQTLATTESLSLAEGSTSIDLSTNELASESLTKRLIFTKVSAEEPASIEFLAELSALVSLAQETAAIKSPDEEAVPVKFLSEEPASESLAKEPASVGSLAEEFSSESLAKETVSIEFLAKVATDIGPPDEELASVEPLAQGSASVEPLAEESIAEEPVVTEPPPEEPVSESLSEEPDSESLAKELTLVESPAKDPASLESLAKETATIACEDEKTISVESLPDRSPSESLSEEPDSESLAKELTLVESPAKDPASFESLAKETATIACEDEKTISVESLPDKSSSESLSEESSSKSLVEEAVSESLATGTAAIEFPTKELASVESLPEEPTPESLAKKLAPVEFPVKDPAVIESPDKVSTSNRPSSIHLSNLHVALPSGSLTGATQIDPALGENTLSKMNIMRQMTFEDKNLHYPSRHPNFPSTHQPAQGHNHYHPHMHQHHEKRTFNNLQLKSPRLQPEPVSECPRTLISSTTPNHLKVSDDVPVPRVALNKLSPKIQLPLVAKAPIPFEKYYSISSPGTDKFPLMFGRLSFFGSAILSITKATFGLAGELDQFAFRVGPGFIVFSDGLKNRQSRSNRERYAKAITEESLTRKALHIRRDGLCAVLEENNDGKIVLSVRVIGNLPIALRILRHIGNGYQSNLNSLSGCLLRHLVIEGDMVIIGDTDLMQVDVDMQLKGTNKSTFASQLPNGRMWTVCELARNPK